MLIFALLLRDLLRLFSILYADYYALRYYAPCRIYDI